MLETQVGRIESDIESEKGTRSRANADLEIRLRSVERSNWMGVGALALLQIILGVILAFAKH